MHGQQHFQTFWRLRKITESDHSLRQICLSVCLYVCVEQLGSKRTDFNEIGCWRIFKKSIDKIQVSLKSDKNIGHFTCRPIYVQIW
jgi:hypothetical protein